ncbi:isocitrate/isopropylmalate dehydrogenase family protein [Candidatus Micrarchaeota archaeon]|nr:isocitrate/isopropylmalate dehydrogenase family protein [Candidatus Micrarchaeota archaeon]
MVKHYSVAVIEGDGIGPEIVSAAKNVLAKAGQSEDISFEFLDAPAGAKTFQQTGTALPKDTLQACRDADAVIKGPVGLPSVTPGVVERDVVLGLRQELDLYANVRPTVLYPSLLDQSPLRAEKVKDGVDILFVRENSEGLYSRQGSKDQHRATDVSVYSQKGVDRILAYAFQAAENRKKKVTSVDKANVLKTSLFWRERFEAIGKTHPGIKTESVYVDAMSQYLLRCPSNYDVVVTDNLFGDILTDEASEITGSLGLGPGANLNPETKTGMFEPLHGSAPEIGGKNVANPIGMILSMKLLLEFLGHPEAGKRIDDAVQHVLEKGYRTADIAGKNTIAIGTREMGARIASMAGT